MISLNKALKIKNRLSGELAKLQVIAVQNNSVREDQLDGRTIVLENVWNEMALTRASLIDIKGKIAAASAAIAPKLVKMAELKAEIVFLNSLPVKEGNEDFVSGYGANSSVKTVKWNSYISAARKSELIREFQNSIDSLQDEIDEYNATTKIDFNL